MKHYLLYDARCSRCAALAAEIESSSDGRLGIRDLRDEAIVEVLDRHAPNRKWEPLVMATDGRHVRIYAGLAMRAKLLLVLGFHKAREVAQLVIKADGPVLGFEPKWFRPLLTSLGLGAVFGALGFGSGAPHLTECDGKVCGPNMCSTWDYEMCPNLCYYPSGTSYCVGGWGCDPCA